MTHSDLRPGNIVGYEKPVHVNLGSLMLGNKMVMLESYGIHLIESDNNTKVFPIELTPDMLIRFGFKYQDRDINSGTPQRFYISQNFGKHREYWLEMNFPRIKEGRFFWWLNWNIGAGREFVHLPNGEQLKYIHQLQNWWHANANEELKLFEK